MARLGAQGHPAAPLASNQLTRTMSNVRLDVLAAEHGDALVITYRSDTRGRSVARVLVDGGPATAYETGLKRSIEDLPADDRHFELAIVTHIDADHIDGTILLMREREALGVTFGEIWFNDWERIEMTRGAKQGELLSWLLRTSPASAAPSGDGSMPEAPPSDAPARFALNVNAAFGGDGPVEQALDDRVLLPNGAEIIVLAPRRIELRRLARSWQTTLEREHFTPGTGDVVTERLLGRYTPSSDDTRDGRRQLDTAVANGSSIAVLLLHARRRLLLAGDAFAPVLQESLETLCERFGVDRLRVDAFKLPHHGSAANLTEGLLNRLDCRRFIVSTNGSYFNHPDKETIELIASLADPGRPPTIVFNYRCATTAAYADHPRIRAEYGSDGRAQIEL